MNIVHYTLGIPPLRKGGAIDYVCKLAKEQAEVGDNVTILYPGDLHTNKSKTYVKFLKVIDKVDICVLKNPLPISINNGFYSYDSFMSPRNIDAVIRFFKKNSIDVIHLHTLSGLPRELLITLKKELKIKILYTTHDYLCLAPNRLFYYDQTDYSSNNCDELWYVVSGAGHFKKVKTVIFQSKHYVSIRKVAKKINRLISLKRINKNSNSIKNLNTVEIPSKIHVKIKKLRKYYEEMFALVDMFLFNSTVAKEVFEKNLNDINGKIVHISNLNDTALNYNKLKEIPKKFINIGYIGPYYQKYKGFYLMVDISKHYLNKLSFKFVFLGDNKRVQGANIVNMGEFDSDDKKSAYSSIDLLVIASDCKETFGLIGLEALLEGVPVVSSINAGFKDMLSEKYIFNGIDDLIDIIDQTNNYKQFYDDYFSELNVDNIKSVTEHASIIKKIYHEFF